MTAYPMNSCPPFLPVTVTSFGFGHLPTPDGAHAVVDVRHHFRDPHVNPALRHLTAEDEQVMHAVMDTPGAEDLTRAIADLAHAFGRGPTPGPITIAIGCVGGRHRAPAIAIQVAAILDGEGFNVTLTHRDINRPVIGWRVDKCGMWAYADGATWVCSKTTWHRGDHHDEHADQSWSTPFTRR